MVNRSNSSIVKLGLRWLAHATFNIAIIPLGNGLRWVSAQTTKLLPVLVVCATVSAIAIFVWPTPYNYEAVRNGYGAVLGIVRINRFTGDAEVRKPHCEAASGSDDGRWTDEHGVVRLPLPGVWTTENAILFLVVTVGVAIAGRLCVLAVRFAPPEPTNEGEAKSWRRSGR
jgi:hypothetical protein